MRQTHIAMMQSMGQSHRNMSRVSWPCGHGQLCYSFCRDSPAVVVVIVVVCLLTELKSHLFLVDFIN